MWKTIILEATLRNKSEVRQFLKEPLPGQTVFMTAIVDKQAIPELPQNYKAFLFAISRDDGKILTMFVDVETRTDEMIFTSRRNIPKYDYCYDPFVRDDTVYFVAIAPYSGTYWEVFYQLQNDREIALAAVAHHGCAMGWISNELKHDIHIALSALRTQCSSKKCIWGSPIDHVPSALFENPEFIQIASTISGISHPKLNVV